MERRIPILLVAVSVVIVLLVPQPPVHAETAATVLSDVTVSSQSDAITVFVKTSREPKYTAELIARPSRLVVDLENAVYAWRKTPLTVSADPVTRIRGSQYRKGIARVVFDLSRDVGYAIREEDHGLAIVIPTAPVAVAQTSPVAPAEDATVAAAEPAPPALPAPPVVPPPSPLPAAGEAPVQVAQAGSRPAATAPAGGSRLISFDFKDADVVNLLRILAAESNKNIVIGDDVKGKMSITLRNVPWNLAFQTVLDTRGLQKVETDGVIRIVSTEQLLKEREAKQRVEEQKLKAENDIRAKAAEAKLKEQEALAKQRANEEAQREAIARGPLKEETIRLSYADPVELAKTLQGILGLSGGSAPAPAAPGGFPPIAAPPFSALYGTAPSAGPGAPPTPAPEVLAKGITIQPHTPTNSIFIRHYEADLERIKKLIREKLDVPLPQVKIEARMNEINRTDFLAFGISWGGAAVKRLTTGGDVLVGQGFAGRTAPTTGIPPVFFSQPPNNPNLTLSQFLPVSAVNGLPSGGNLVDFPGATLTGVTPASIAFGIVSRKMNINVVLDALEQMSKSTSLAKPEIVTTENMKATISLGSEIPYATVSSAGTQIQFKEALLKLDVTPTVVKEGETTKVKLVVNVDNNSVGANVPVAGGGFVPSINKRTASTQVIVKERETLVIGGIRQRQTDENIRKVPFFGDIPILGYLFKATTRQTDPNRELVVFITPYVLKTDQVSQK